jgi:hypothetical protein
LNHFLSPCKTVAAPAPNRSSLSKSIVVDNTSSPQLPLFEPYNDIDRIGALPDQSIMKSPRSILSPK